jgi:hypothetical protein
MTDPREPNTRAPSTTWTWERRKIRRPAGGQQSSQPKAARWWHLPLRDRRKPLTLTISYRGGPECWYEIHARGSIGRFPGHAYLHDVMAAIYGEHQDPQT